MPTQQTGLRIDRVLYKQFQQLYDSEKLRPSEAVESLIRAAVNAKSITGIQHEGLTWPASLILAVGLNAYFFWQ